MTDKKKLTDIIMTAQTTMRLTEGYTTREEAEYIAEALVYNGVVIVDKASRSAETLQTLDMCLISDLNHIAGVLEGLSYCVPDNVSEGLCNQAEIIDGILGRLSILPEVDDGKIK